MFEIDTVPLIVIGCALLCGVGVVLFFVLQIVDFIGTIFGVFFNIIELGLDILSGGPIAWCGCLFAILVAVVGIIVIVLIVDSLSACGTPDATNLCTLFGR